MNWFGLYNGDGRTYAAVYRGSRISSCAKVACHHLTVTLLAGMLAEREHIEAVETWQTLLDQWEEELPTWLTDHKDMEYREEPLRAYHLSYESLDSARRAIVDALRFFPSAQEVPAVAIEGVWRHCTAADSQHKQFRRLFELSSQAEQTWGAGKARFRRTDSDASANNKV